MLIFSYPPVNICFGCSKEPSHKDDSLTYPQPMFFSNENFFVWYTILTKAPGLGVSDLVKLNLVSLVTITSQDIKFCKSQVKVSHFSIHHNLRR